MKINEIIQLIQEHAPTGIQESYDNSGLITGDPEQETDLMLVCLDVTEEVVLEAIEAGAGLIVSHHPLIFKGIRRISGQDATGRILIQAIRHNLAIYAAHTNLDKVIPGVSTTLAEKLGLTRLRILAPEQNSLLKLVTFIPSSHLEEVSLALFAAGAGRIGDYDSCSFQVEGSGTFRGLEGSNPFVGDKGSVHHEKEVRFEAVVPSVSQHRVVSRLLDVHPYEEVAWDLIPLKNPNPYMGLGVIGELTNPMTEVDFMSYVKEKLKLTAFKYTRLTNQLVRQVALCGGSGSEFLPQAIESGAQVFLSADFKYHQFFEAEDRILILDIGHYESEIQVIHLIKQLVTKKFPKFAVRLSDVNTNPIKYY